MATFRERVDTLGLEPRDAAKLIASLTDEKALDRATVSRWLSDKRDPAAGSPVFTAVVNLLRRIPWSAFQKLCRYIGMEIADDPRTPIG